MSQSGALSSSGGGGIDIVSLTGNSGGAVHPDSMGNIDVIGSAGITVTGDNATHTLTVTGSAVVLTVDADSGTAMPSAGIINVNGSNTGTTVSTSASGDTLVIANTFDVNGDSGSASPSTGSFSIVGGSNVTTSATGSTVTISVADVGLFPWNEVTLSAATMAIDNGYVANNAGVVTLTLPLLSAFGSVIKITGKGAGGWSIAQNALQTIVWDSTDATTVGVTGSLAANDIYCSLEMVCITANTTWMVLSAKGNFILT